MTERRPDAPFLYCSCIFRRLALHLDSPPLHVYADAVLELLKGAFLTAGLFDLSHACERKYFAQLKSRRVVQLR